MSSFSALTTTLGATPIGQRCFFTCDSTRALLAIAIPTLIILLITLLYSIRCSVVALFIVGLGQVSHMPV